MTITYTARNAVLTDDIKTYCERRIATLEKLPVKKLKKKRYDKYRNMGVFEE